MKNIRISLTLAAAALGAGAAPIYIRVGRQLFVDDYLVESSSGLVRHWNRRVK